MLGVKVACRCSKTSLLIITLQLLAARPVDAQIGMLSSEIPNRFGAHVAAPAEAPLKSYKEVFGVTLLELKCSSPNRFSNLNCDLWMSIPDGKCRLIARDSTDDSKEVDNFLSTFNINQASEYPIRWQLHTGFNTLFPDLGGRPSGWVNRMAVFAPTGTSTRTVTIDPSSNRVVGATPWSNDIAPTGQVITTVTRYTNWRNKLVLISEDAKSYAILVIATSKGDINSTYASSIVICDAEMFWQVLVAQIRRTQIVIADDSYETRLNSALPADSKPEICARRLASAFAAIVSSGSFSHESCLEKYRDVAKLVPSFSSFVDAAMVDEIHKQSLAARSSRARVLADVGTQTAIPKLANLLSTKSSEDLDVKDALRAIAAREQLLDPPDDKAAWMKWKKWSSDVAPVK